MGPTLSPKTSAFKLQTPGKFPEEYRLHSHIRLCGLYKQKFAFTVMTFTEMAKISQEHKLDMSMIQTMVIFWGFKPSSTGLL